MARRGLPALLLAALAIAALLAPTWCPAQDAPSPAPAERQDTVIGTGGGAAQSGRDPSTGDTVLKVTPQEQPREQYAVPPVTVQPEITWPAGKPKQKQE